MATTGFFSGIGDLFGDTNLGDVGQFVGGVATAVSVLKKDKAPELGDFAPPAPVQDKNVVQNLAEEQADQRKRQRLNTRASRRVSFLSDTDIGAVKLNA